MAGQNYVWIVSWSKSLVSVCKKKAFVSKVKALQFMVQLKNEGNCRIDLHKSFNGD